MVEIHNTYTPVAAGTGVYGIQAESSSLYENQNDTDNERNQCDHLQFFITRAHQYTECSKDNDQ